MHEIARQENKEKHPEYRRKPRPIAELNTTATSTNGCLLNLGDSAPSQNEAELTMTEEAERSGKFLMKAVRRADRVMTKCVKPACDCVLNFGRQQNGEFKVTKIRSHSCAGVTPANSRTGSTAYHPDQFAPLVEDHLREKPNMKSS